MPIHGYPGGVITANPVAPTSTVATGVWTTEQQLQATSAGNWPRPGPLQPISRSLRFSGAYPATPSYLSRTSGAPTNNIKWTFSFWAKRGVLSVGQHILNGGTGSSASEDYLVFLANNKLAFYQGNATTTLIATNAVFRDASAWYHIVLVYDSAQATSTNRLFIYVNNVSQSFSSTTYPTLNQSTNINANGVLQRISSRTYLADEGLDGYMTEMYFIDGQALTPSSFGQTNASTGVWEPIPYTGTYGTNGFYLNFSDNSNTTAATLGKDYSGNGNNWTPNNFSVTAGVGNDSLVDSPTSYGTDTGVGGEVRGNYATLNPLAVGPYATLSDGNLKISGASATDSSASYSTIGMTTGKWYFEVINTGSGYGVSTFGYALVADVLNAQALLQTSFAGYRTRGNTYGTVTSTFATWEAGGEVIGVAVDCDNGAIYFARNNTWINSGDPTSGASKTGAITTYTGGSKTLYGGGGAYSTSSQNVTLNFGQRPFAYTAPSGFKALCTQNLPTPTIGATSTTQANDYFNTVLWTGNDATRTITGYGFQPDFIWTKGRNVAAGHRLSDAVRGASGGTMLNLNTASTDADNTDTAITGFASDGFTMNGSNHPNVSPYTYVGWGWNAGGSTVTNTSGTISAQVRANTTSGFSIVTYTGTGVTGTVGHGIGTAPSMIIVKSRSLAGSNWDVYHIATGNTGRLFLDLTSAFQTVDVWNNTSPTSTVFTINGARSDVNNSGSTYVAYCFAPVAGYSAFGSYSGNASTDGPFVYTGFRPEFIMTRSTSGSREWYMYDAARDTYNVATNYLRANTSAAEGSFTSYDMVSNGFKLRSSDTAFNGSGETYIYMAFAEFPFKFSLAR